MKSINNKKSFLSFKLADEIFAISVTKVLEVLEIQPITKVPQTPDYIRGVINFRGEILPVIETRIKFNMAEKETDHKSVIIVLDLIVRNKRVILGALVDGVKDVLEIDEKSIKEVPDMGSRYDINFLEGMIKTEKGFIMILNIDKVFTVEDITLVEAAEEAGSDAINAES